MRPDMKPTEGWRPEGERPLEFRTDVPPELRTDGPRVDDANGGEPHRTRSLPLIRWGLTIALLLLIPALCSG